MKMNALIIVMLTLFSCENDKPEDLGNEHVLREVLREEREDLDLKISNVTFSNLPAPITKLTKTGSLEMRVNDLDKTKAELSKLLKVHGAHTTSETMNHTEDRQEIQQTIRVPAPQFDSVLLLLAKLALRVDHQNISTEDVTPEFIDMEARLRTKQGLENRYRELFKQAKSVADLLTIENQLADIRGEIESTEERLMYLNDQVAMSTIYLTYYEALGVDFGIGGKFVTSLQEGWDNLLGFIIFLVRIWPFTIMVGVGGFWLGRKIRRRPA